MEGIIPALAHAINTAPAMPHESILLLCLSGRGNKDVVSVAAYLEKSKS